MAGTGVRAVGTALVCLLAVLALVAPAAAQADAAGDRAWVQRALDLQYELAADVPLANTPWVSTHNSYNSQAEMGPTLSAQDANHHLTIVDQLDEGVRHLELDPHEFISVTPEAGLQRIVVCHATAEHGGCTVEKPLITVMRQIRGWLDANPDQVVMIYFDTALDSVAGHDAAADVLEETVGDRMVRPPSGGSACNPLPLDLTRGQIRAQGKQVLMFAPCGQGAKWPSVVFDERRRLTGPDNTAIKPFPDCGPDFTRAQYDAFPTRYFEDATQVGAVAGTADPLTPELTERMSRCGVDLIAFDFLQRGDERLERLVWSWAPAEPSAAGSCAIQRADGRWESRPCGELHRAACRRTTGAWFVPPGLATADAARGLCAAAGGVNDVPRTAYDGQLLTVEAARADASSVWLAYRSPSGGGAGENGDAGGGPGSGSGQGGASEGGSGQGGSTDHERSQAGGPRCFTAATQARAKRLGRAGLGNRRSKVRRTFGAEGRYRRFLDRYCLADDSTIRVGYPSLRQLRQLVVRERRRLRAKVSLVLTSSGQSAVRGVNVGDSVRELRRKTGSRRGVRVGRNVWYVRRGERAGHVFKVQDGVVREVGLADRKQTATNARVKRFFTSGR